MRTDQKIHVHKKKKLAVIGGGIAGLSSAFLFSDRYDVTLFEKKDYLGGNNRSIEIDDGHKVPLISILFPRKQIFNHTHKLIQNMKLPLAYRVMNHAFQQDGKLRYHITANPIELIKNLSRNSIGTFSKDIYFFLTKFRNIGSHQQFDDRTVRQLVIDGDLSKEFVEIFLIPMICIYVVLPFEEAMDLPIEIVAKWYYKYLLMNPFDALQFTFIKNGNHQLVDQLVKKIKGKVILNCGKLDVVRDTKKVKIYRKSEMKVFDKVVFATHPKTALQLLRKPMKMEEKLLNAIPYQTIKCILHRDPSLSLGNSLTFNLKKGPDHQREVVVTMSQKCFGYDLKNPIYLSGEQCDINTVKAKDIIFEQVCSVPKVSAELMETIPQLSLLNKNKLNTYYCGSYFGEYFYHEDAIQSALNISDLDLASSI